MPAVAIPLIISAVGTGYAAYQQHKAGEAAKDLGEFNGQVADAQAADAILRGKTNEEKFRQGVRMLIGGQRAGFAGQGVDVGSGSALDVQADASYLGELDALTIRNNAAREAWGYKVQGQNARMGGQNAANAGNAQATATVLGGVGQGYSVLANRYGWNRPAA